MLNTGFAKIGIKELIPKVVISAVTKHTIQCFSRLTNRTFLIWHARGCVSGECDPKPFPSRPSLGTTPEMLPVLAYPWVTLITSI